MRGLVCLVLVLLCSVWLADAGLRIDASAQVHPRALLFCVRMCVRVRACVCVCVCACVRVCVCACDTSPTNSENRI